MLRVDGVLCPILFVSKNTYQTAVGVQAREHRPFSAINQGNRWMENLDLVWNSRRKGVELRLTCVPWYAAQIIQHPSNTFNIQIGLEGCTSSPRWFLLSRRNLPGNGEYGGGEGVGSLQDRPESNQGSYLQLSCLRSWTRCGFCRQKFKDEKYEWVLWCVLWR